jgi:hypothetical protein
MKRAILAIVLILAGFAGCVALHEPTHRVEQG